MNWLVICEPYRLIYRPVPKCASTTLFNLLGELGGFGPSSRPREALPTVRADDSPGRDATYVVRCDGEALIDFARRHADYFWFSVVRDPYARVASNYHNKLNRYAKRFALGAYLRGYAGQVLSGRAVWRGGHDRTRHMQTRIPFERFVRGLQRHGIGWDPHFIPQTEVLHIEDIRYHHLVKMERLTAGLREMLAQAKTGEAGEAAVARIAWLNPSGGGRAQNLWTPDTRAIVADLYRRDFETLGYPT